MENLDFTRWPGINNHRGMNGHQIPFVIAIVPALLTTMEGAIPNSVRIAQAIQESGWGTSRLAREANAIFGIKADRRWNGPVFNTRTGEWSPTLGNHTITANFRAYNSWAESIADHRDFLRDNPRYADLFKMKDPDDVARGLQAAGYATDPNYANTLIRLINQNHLRYFDNFHLFKKTLENKNIPEPVVSPVGQCLTFEKLAKKQNTDTIQVGSYVRIQEGALWMTDPPRPIPNWVMPLTHRVDRIDNGERVVLNQDGINSPIHINNLRLV